MSLFLLYEDPDTKENKELFIQVCLNSDYNSENTITEHPAETKKSFTDNSLENLKDIPVTIFIPAEELIEVVVKKEDITKASNSGVILNGIPVDSRGIPITSSTIGTQLRKKEEVLNLLENLKTKAAIIDYLNINNRVYSSYLLKSISFNESIDSGDGWDISLVFREARKVNSQKTKLTKDIIQKLKAALAAATARNDGSLSNIQSKIKTSNKTSGIQNKGNQNSGRIQGIESIIKGEYSGNPEEDNTIKYLGSGKYQIGNISTDAKSGMLYRKIKNAGLGKYIVGGNRTIN